MSDLFADARYLERVHRAYISVRAADQLRATGDAVWLRRGIALAALGQGGTDYRDLHVALADLWDAAEAAGLDPAPAFRQIGAFASSQTGRGGLPCRIQEFLMQYRH